MHQFGIARFVQQPVSDRPIGSKEDESLFRMVVQHKWFVSKFTLIAGILGVTCVYGKGELGDKCGVGEDCKVANSTCIFGICTCNIGTYHDADAKRCLAGVPMGGKCTDEDYCSSLNNACVGGVCGCLPGYSASSSGCLPDVKSLGESCQAHAQCVTPFSHCADGSCTCKPGFSNSDGQCFPDEVHCPVGKPPLQDGMLIYCSMNIDGSHDCPSGMGCLPIDEPVLYRDDTSLAGFCCKYPEQSDSEPPSASCPYGLSEPIEECSGGKWETYFTYSDIYFGISSAVLCCPRICTYKRAYHDGKCYESLLGLNDTCEYAFQCWPGQMCVGGKCVCKEGHKQLYNNCFVPVCPYGQAVMEADGVTPTKCNGPESCPSDHYCVNEFSICCPDFQEAEEEAISNEESLAP
uniref:EB domain-containing protein n=1 Tax=Trichuris muris TaxID=70415 RepID=A0A5S6QCP7_TRIMR